MTTLVSEIENEKTLAILQEFNHSNDILQQERNVIKLVEFEGVKYVVKSFKLPHLINAVAYKFFRPSKAKRSFEYSQKLSSLGVKVPKPVAYLINYSVYGVKDSYYISEYVDFLCEFREIVDNSQFPDAENILRQFARFTFDLHEKKIYFKDHSPGNTLIVKKDEKNYDFYLIDVNRMIFDYNFTFEKRMENFKRLSLSPAMIEIVSDEYAKLIQADPNLVYERMLHYALLAANKYQKKQEFKKKIGIKK